jgi:hypothetical protein
LELCKNGFVPGLLSVVFGSRERLQIICDYLFLRRRFSLAAGKEIVSLQQLKIDPVWDSIR